MTKQAPRKPTPSAGAQPAIPTFDPETDKEMFVRAEKPPIFPLDGPVHVKLELDENNVLKRTAPTPDEAIRITLPRAIVEKILGGMMSRASVRAYGSTWITGTETSLPLVVAKTLDTDPKEGGAYTWGQSGVSFEEAQTLHTLAQALGYWVKPDAQGVYRPVKSKA